MAEPAVRVVAVAAAPVAEVAGQAAPGAVVVVPE
jgi:hypothetical protein